MSHCENENCGKPLPPSTRRRRFCDNRCRMAASRAEAAAPAVPVEGPVTAAVAQALSECTFYGADNAKAALALSLARLTDGGSVPAAAQLRAVLDDLITVADPDTLAFLASIRTPGQSGAPISGNGAV